MSIKSAFRHLLPNWLVNLFFHLPVAVLASIYYGWPSRKLKVIGITGTDGKTTTASLIYHVLKSAGKKVALVSTVSAKIGDEDIPTGFHVTSPDPWKLQALLQKIADGKFEYLVLEVTSHGLDQFRVFGINFLIGVITNVTREHLDYHKTYENYLAAKAKLFDKSKTAILNVDDESYEHLRARAEQRKAKILTYGIKNSADFTPKSFVFKTSLHGEYNQYNCLAAIAAASAIGVDQKQIRATVASFKGVVGRMEEVEMGQNFRAIVDFAHTPNALQNVLSTLKRELKAGNKLIVVFGCAGLRDKQKRPIMGQISAKYADRIILTAEDPRTEDLGQIIEQIAGGCLSMGAEEKPIGDEQGMGRGKYFYRIPDRAEAINYAIKIAQKGDIMIACGKGHEESMCFGKTERQWSDRKAIEQAIKFLLKKRVRS